MRALPFRVLMVCFEQVPRDLPEGFGPNRTPTWSMRLFHHIHSRCLTLEIVVLDGHKWLCAAAHASPVSESKEKSRKLIYEFSSGLPVPWALTGDFNGYLNTAESRGGQFPLSRALKFKERMGAPWFTLATKGIYSLMLVCAMVFILFMFAWIDDYVMSYAEYYSQKYLCLSSEFQLRHGRLLLKLWTPTSPFV